MAETSYELRWENAQAQPLFKLNCTERLSEALLGAGLSTQQERLDAVLACLPEERLGGCGSPLLTEVTGNTRQLGRDCLCENSGSDPIGRRCGHGCLRSPAAWIVHAMF